LDDLNGGFLIEINFLSKLDIGLVTYSGPIGNLIKGLSQEGYDYGSQRSDPNYKPGQLSFETNLRITIFQY
jgi:hypothetical protein